MTTSTETSGKPGGRLPPRFVIRAAWVGHRALYRFSGGRLGLRPATEKSWGMMRLKTVGRKSGRERMAILGYYEDGPNLVTMAMNGWGEPEPGMVAEPPGPSRHDGRAPRSNARRARARRDRRRAAAPVGDLGSIRRAGESRRVGVASAARNRGRHPRASLRVGARTRNRPNRSTSECNQGALDASRSTILRNSSNSPWKLPL